MIFFSGHKLRRPRIYFPGILVVYVINLLRTIFAVVKVARLYNLQMNRSAFMHLYMRDMRKQNGGSHVIISCAFLFFNRDERAS